MTLPPVPADFEWIDAPWGAALRCVPLAPIARHLFTTRPLALADDGAWVSVADTLEVAPSRVWRLKQVHGNAVIVANGDAPATRPEADALISIDPSVALSVVAADCVPLLMADTRTGAVAAVHAGWRGTAAKIAVAAVGAMQREFGTRAEDLVAALGPSIGPCCYEVGTELVDAFAAAGHERYLIDRWFQARPPRRGEPRTAAPKLRLDVPGSNRDQLILAGVPPEQIHVSGLCTAMHLDVLTSFRMEKTAAVRLAGVIRPGSRP
jgi:YfiH family protein